MCRKILESIAHSFWKLRKDIAGSIAPTFALTLIPIVTAVGAAVDYSRALSVKTTLQAALDSAVVMGAKTDPTQRVDAANKFFLSNVALKNASIEKPQFSSPTPTTFTGTVSASVPTSMLGILHINSMDVSAKSTATSSDPDNSCILTLDTGQPASHVSLNLNGAPVINLAGCSLRSNTAMNCNGHDGDLTKAISYGTASGCGHPQPYTPPVPDIYTSLATNISLSCGTLRPGVTWTAGTTPYGGGFSTVNKAEYTEIHICGNLTLSGNGYLTGASPTKDTVIIIENGSLNIEADANVSAKRTAIVLGGNNNYASKINFPNGNGQSATLTLSAPTSPENVWQGVALYQDPALTKDINNKWGPGATFNADGLVYLGKSNVVTDGNTSSSNAKCSKFVMNTFTTNGSIALNFDQSIAACAAIGLKQWGGVIVHIIR